MNLLNELVEVNIYNNLLDKENGDRKRTSDRERWGSNINRLPNGQTE